MKAFPVLVLSLLLVSGVSAFASTGASSPVTLSPASIHTWIGKAANQLIQVLGEPSYTTAEKNGRQPSPRFPR